MIRTRQESQATPLAGPPSRDAYFAGMRCVGKRSLSRREVFGLVVLGYGGLIAGVVSSVSLAELLVSGTQYLTGKHAVGLLLIATPVWLVAAVLVPPILGTLRAGYVYVFRGECRSLGGFDGNQTELLANKRLPDEILLLADHRTVYKIDRRFFPRPFPLCRSSFIANDREATTRPLSTGEKRELKDLIRHYRRLNLLYFSKGLLFTFFITRLLFLFEGANAFGFVLCVLGALALLTFIAYSHLPAFRFAQRLGRDLDAGTIVDGCLKSGAPWLVDGSPAGWRFVRWRLGGTLSDADSLLKL